MARAYGSRAQMALAFETTYGTAPASGYVQVPFASGRISAARPLIDSELLGYGRDPLAPIGDAIAVDGDVTIPVDVTAFGYWLKGLLGNPVTTGTTPKVHTFASGGYTLPSMSVETGHPEVPSFDMASGVRVNTLRIAMERRGQLQATVGLIGQSDVPDTETNAGTPAAITLQRFGHFNGAISRNGSALGSIESAEMTYSNNMEPVDVIRADGLIDGVDPTIASLRGTLTARFDGTTLIDQAIAGTACELSFAWTISANASLVITAHSVFLPRPRKTLPGPGGIQVTFDWQAALAASPARMMTAVLTNAQADY